MRAQELRELVEADELLVAPGCFDALTARLVESLGYDAVYLGGYATGAATAATEPMTTMSEMCDRARELTHNVDVPLTVDGNAGFGNPSHTYRSVQEYAKTGIAGMHIEDQVYPKRLHYHAGRHHIVDPDEMVLKIETAVTAKHEMNEDIFLIARSDANRGNRREFESIEDPVNRINTYLDAGAEAGMLFPQNREELEYAAEHADGALVYVLAEGIDPNPSVELLDDLGYGMVIYPISATVSAIRAIKETYETLERTGNTDISPEEFEETTGEVEELIDLPKFHTIEERAGKK